jgi:hypothetical protein
VCWSVEPVLLSVFTAAVNISNSYSLKKSAARLFFKM